jgi:hypothetical protein
MNLALTIAPSVEEVVLNADTMTRLIGEYCTFYQGVPTGDGWTTFDAFTTPKTGYLQQHLAAIGQAQQSDSAKVQVMYAFNGFNWIPVLATLCAYIESQRVPDLTRATIAFRFNEQMDPEAVAISAPHFACLPTDPYAHHPHAIVCPNEGALRNYGRIQLETFARRLINALRPYSSTNPQTLWWAMADRITATLGWLTQELKVSERLLPEWNQWVQVKGSPFQGPSTFFTVEWKGKVEYHLDRAVCCLWYQTGAQTKCTSCCLRPLEERQAKMLEYMQSQSEA